MPYGHPLPSGYVGSGYTGSVGVYSPHPFTAKFLTARITKCQGCGNKFRQGKTTSAPLRPHCS